MFEFMVCHTCYFALPCKQCGGVHIVTLPTNAEPEKREAKT